MKNEKIIEINEFEEDGYSGYEVKTNKQKIKLMIQNHQDCCEDWGYFFSNDDFEDFIGANIINVTITDTALKTKRMDEIEYLEDGDVMFVNIETNKGVLQFTAYNSHNGYYGHEAKVICEQLEHSEYL